MTSYQITLDEQTPQRLFTSDTQLAHLLEALLNQVLLEALLNQVLWLKGRGLHGVDLVVSDHHGGLTTAVRVQFQEASWQRCQMHLSANINSAAPKAVQEELHARVCAIFEAPDIETARTLLA